MSYDFARYLRQMKLEQEMLDLGYDRTEQRITRLREGGEASKSPLGVRLTRSLLPDLMAAFTAYVKEKKTGPKAPARELLRLLNPEAIAYLTTRGVLDAIGSGEQSESAVAAQIGEDLLEPVRWREDAPRGANAPDAALHVGTTALHIWQRETADEFTRAYTTFNGPKYLYSTTKLDDLLRDEPEDYLLPRFMPCVVPPAPWTSTRSHGLRGGYFHEGLRKRLVAVKHQPQNYLEDASHTEMPAVLSAVNAVQATPWRINRRVFDVLRAATKPRRKSQVHRALVIARKFLKDSAIYFPVTLDFTGRLYPVPIDLNPYGADGIKALLTFAQGKPLGTQDAADALAVHGANTFGVKGTRKERMDWVNDHDAEILAIADDPYGGPWWFVASKKTRWQFLAFCFEWAGYRREGLAFVSTLPVVMDGSCNGLQHFSAMLRDEIGGEAVNLVPLDRPRDIYQDVADKVNANMGREVVTRTIVKPCVMNYPYGMTVYGRWDALRDEYREVGVDDADVVEVERHVIAAIKTTVVKASEVMDWLKDDVLQAAQLPLAWQTPSGFPAMQWEIEQQSIDVLSVVDGERKRLPFWINPPDMKQDRQAAKAGIAPNFVHSMDASHLHLTVTAAGREGITSFAMEHDGFGTVAADAPALAVILREQFVRMYEKHDPLRELRDQVGLSDMPAPGTLNIRGVLDSKYFFA